MCERLSWFVWHICSSRTVAISLPLQLQDSEIKHFARHSEVEYLIHYKHLEWQLSFCKVTKSVSFVLENWVQTKITLALRLTSARIGVSRISLCVHTKCLR